MATATRDRIVSRAELDESFGVEDEPELKEEKRKPARPRKPKAAAAAAPTKKRNATSLAIAAKLKEAAVVAEEDAPVSVVEAAMVNAAAAVVASGAEASDPIAIAASRKKAILDATKENDDDDDAKKEKEPRKVRFKRERNPLPGGEDHWFRTAATWDETSLATVKDGLLNKNWVSIDDITDKMFPVLSEATGFLKAGPNPGDRFRQIMWDSKESGRQITIQKTKFSVKLCLDSLKRTEEERQWEMYALLREQLAVNTGNISGGASRWKDLTPEGFRRLLLQIFANQKNSDYPNANRVITMYTGKRKRKDHAEKADLKRGIVRTTPDTRPEGKAVEDKDYRDLWAALCYDYDYGIVQIKKSRRRRASVADVDIPPPLPAVPSAARASASASPAAVPASGSVINLLDPDDIDDGPTAAIIASTPATDAPIVVKTAAELEAEFAADIPAPVPVEQKKKPRAKKVSPSDVPPPASESAAEREKRLFEEKRFKDTPGNVRQYFRVDGSWSRVMEWDRAGIIRSIRNDNFLGEFQWLSICTGSRLLAIRGSDGKLQRSNHADVHVATMGTALDPVNDTYPYYEPLRNMPGIDGNLVSGNYKNCRQAIIDYFTPDVDTPERRLLWKALRWDVTRPHQYVNEPSLKRKARDSASEAAEPASKVAKKETKRGDAAGPDEPGESKEELVVTVDEGEDEEEEEGETKEEAKVPDPSSDEADPYACMSIRLTARVQEIERQLDIAIKAEKVAKAAYIRNVLFEQANKDNPERNRLAAARTKKESGALKVERTRAEAERKELEAFLVKIERISDGELYWSKLSNHNAVNDFKLFRNAPEPFRGDGHQIKILDVPPMAFALEDKPPFIVVPTLMNDTKNPEFKHACQWAEALGIKNLNATSKLDMLYYMPKPPPGENTHRQASSSGKLGLPLYQALFNRTAYCLTVRTVDSVKNGTSSWHGKVVWCIRDRVPTGTSYGGDEIRIITFNHEDNSVFELYIAAILYATRFVNVSREMVRDNRLEFSGKLLILREALLKVMGPAHDYLKGEDYMNDTRDAGATTRTSMQDLAPEEIAVIHRAVELNFREQPNSQGPPRPMDPRIDLDARTLVHPLFRDIIKPDVLKNEKGKVIDEKEWAPSNAMNHGVFMDFIVQAQGMTLGMDDEVNIYDDGSRNVARWKVLETAARHLIETVHPIANTGPGDIRMTYQSFYYLCKYATDQFYALVANASKDPGVPKPGAAGAAAAAAALPTPKNRIGFGSFAALQTYMDSLKLSDPEWLTAYTAGSVVPPELVIGPGKITNARILTQFYRLSLARRNALSAYKTTDTNIANRLLMIMDRMSVLLETGGPNPLDGAKFPREFPVEMNDAIRRYVRFYVNECVYATILRMSILKLAAISPITVPDVSEENARARDHYEDLTAIADEKRTREFPERGTQFVWTDGPRNYEQALRLFVWYMYTDRTVSGEYLGVCASRIDITRWHVLRNYSLVFAGSSRKNPKISTLFGLHAPSEASIVGDARLVLRNVMDRLNRPIATEKLKGKAAAAAAAEEPGAMDTKEDKEIKFEPDLGKIRQLEKVLPGAFDKMLSASRAYSSAAAAKASDEVLDQLRKERDETNSVYLDIKQQLDDAKAERNPEKKKTRKKKTEEAAPPPPQAKRPEEEEGPEPMATAEDNLFVEPDRFVKHYEIDPAASPRPVAELLPDQYDYEVRLHYDKSKDSRELLCAYLLLRIYKSLLGIYVDAGSVTGISTTPEHQFTRSFLSGISSSMVLYRHCRLAFVDRKGKVSETTIDMNSFIDEKHEELVRPIYVTLIEGILASMALQEKPQEPEGLFLAQQRLAPDEARDVWRILLAISTMFGNDQNLRLVARHLAIQPMDELFRSNCNPSADIIDWRLVRALNSGPAVLEQGAEAEEEEEEEEEKRPTKKKKEKKPKLDPFDLMEFGTDKYAKANVFFNKREKLIREAATKRAAAHQASYEDLRLAAEVDVTKGMKGFSGFVESVRERKRGREDADEDAVETDTPEQEDKKEKLVGQKFGLIYPNERTDGTLKQSRRAEQLNEFGVRRAFFVAATKANDKKKNKEEGTKKDEAKAMRVNGSAWAKTYAKMYGVKYSYLASQKLSAEVVPNVPAFTKRMDGLQLLDFLDWNLVFCIDYMPAPYLIPGITELASGTLNEAKQLEAVQKLYAFISGKSASGEKKSTQWKPITNTYHDAAIALEAKLVEQEPKHRVRLAEFVMSSAALRKQQIESASPLNRNREMSFSIGGKVEWDWYDRIIKVCTQIIGTAIGGSVNDERKERFTQRIKLRRQQEDNIPASLLLIRMVEFADKDPVTGRLKLDDAIRWTKGDDGGKSRLGDMKAGFANVKWMPPSLIDIVFALIATLRSSAPEFTLPVLRDYNSKAQVQMRVATYFTWVSLHVAKIEVIQMLYHLVDDLKTNLKNPKNRYATVVEAKEADPANLYRKYLLDALTGTDKETAIVRPASAKEKKKAIPVSIYSVISSRLTGNRAYKNRLAADKKRNASAAVALPGILSKLRESLADDKKQLKKIEQIAVDRYNEGGVVAWNEDEIRVIHKRLLKKADFKKNQALVDLYTLLENGEPVFDEATNTTIKGAIASYYEDYEKLIKPNSFIKTIKNAAYPLYKTANLRRRKSRLADGNARSARIYKELTDRLVTGTEFPKPSEKEKADRNRQHKLATAYYAAYEKIEAGVAQAFREDNKYILEMPKPMRKAWSIFASQLPVELKGVTTAQVKISAKQHNALLRIELSGKQVAALRSGVYASVVRSYERARRVWEALAGCFDVVNSDLVVDAPATESLRQPPDFKTYPFEQGPVPSKEFRDANLLLPAVDKLAEIGCPHIAWYRVRTLDTSRMSPVSVVYHLDPGIEIKEEDAQMHSAAIVLSAHCMQQAWAVIGSAKSIHDYIIHGLLGRENEKLLMMASILDSIGTDARSDILAEFRYELKAHIGIRSFMFMQPCINWFVACNRGTPEFRPLTDGEERGAATNRRELFFFASGEELPLMAAYTENRLFGSSSEFSSMRTDAVARPVISSWIRIPDSSEPVAIDKKLYLLSGSLSTPRVISGLASIAKLFYLGTTDPTATFTDDVPQLTRKFIRTRHMRSLQLGMMTETLMRAYRLLILHLVPEAVMQQLELERFVTAGTSPTVLLDETILRENRDAVLVLIRRSVAYRRVVELERQCDSIRKACAALMVKEWAVYNKTVDNLVKAVDDGKRRIFIKSAGVVEEQITEDLDTRWKRAPRLVDFFRGVFPASESRDDGIERTATTRLVEVLSSAQVVRPSGILTMGAVADAFVEIARESMIRAGTERDIALLVATRETRGDSNIGIYLTNYTKQFIEQLEDEKTERVTYPDAMSAFATTANGDVETAEFFASLVPPGPPSAVAVFQTMRPFIPPSEYDTIAAGLQINLGDQPIDLASIQEPLVFPPGALDAIRATTGVSPVTDNLRVINRTATRSTASVGREGKRAPRKRPALAAEDEEAHPPPPTREVAAAAVADIPRLPPEPVAPPAAALPDLAAVAARQKKLEAQAEVKRIKAAKAAAAAAAAAAVKGKAAYDPEDKDIINELENELQQLEF